MKQTTVFPVALVLQLLFLAGVGLAQEPSAPRAEFPLPESPSAALEQQERLQELLPGRGAAELQELLNAWLGAARAQGQESAAGRRAGTGRPAPHPGLAMNTYIALLRGINVGGAGILPMRELVDLLEELGCTAVKTYIQSGNAVFRHRAAAPGLATEIRAAVGAARGFEPDVLYFLAARPGRPDLERLEELRSGRERFALDRDVFYLHAPDGIARSKLASRVEQALGVPATARNWRTVQKLLELARSAP